jgi:hypothetical protein
MAASVEGEYCGGHGDGIALGVDDRDVGGPLVVDGRAQRHHVLVVRVRIGLVGPQPSPQQTRVLLAQLHDQRAATQRSTKRVRRSESNAH